MHTSTKSASFTRAVLGTYLAFALGGLLLCTSAVYVLANHVLQSQVFITSVVAGTFVIGVGLAFLHSVIRPYTLVERELLRLTAAPNQDNVHVATLAGTAAVVREWNRFVDRISKLQTLQSLNEQLSETLKKRDQRKIGDVLDSIPDGIAVTELDGRILQANRSLSALANCGEPDALVGKSLLSVLNLTTAANGRDVERELSASTGPCCVELHRTSRSEDGVWRVSRHPMIDGSMVQQLLWTVRDVTQHSVVNNARNDFVATATHELRTPLSNIKAYAETLAIHEGIDVEQQKEFCNIINAEATRLSRFVDEVLSVSQIESGSLSVERTETDLGRFIRGSHQKR